MHSLSFLGLKQSICCSNYSQQRLLELCHAFGSTDTMRTCTRLYVVIKRGLGWLYAIDIHSGESRFKNDKEEAIAKIDIGSRVPDSLVIHAGVDAQEKSVIRLLGVGQGDKQVIYNEETKQEEVVYKGTVDTNTDMMPRRIYSYFKEN